MKAFIKIALLHLCLATVACGKGAPPPPSEQAADSPSAAQAPSGATVTCPVCGLTFPKKDAEAVADIKGKKYYFYLKDHRDAFVADPDAFLSSAE